MKIKKWICCALVGVGMVLNACGEGATVEDNGITAVEIKAATDDMYAAAIVCEDIIGNVKALWDDEIVFVESVYMNDATWEASKKAFQGVYSTTTIENTRKMVADLEEKNRKVMESSGKLIHWPDSMTEEKEIYDDCYDAYLSLYDLASNPSGNYITYCQNANEYISEFAKQYKKLAPYLE